MKTFIYLRGQPGVGKITVARILEKELGWKVFWFHELKNAVYDIVKEHRIPRLMDELTVPIIRYLLDKEKDIIYVRPSPDQETIDNVRNVVLSKPNHRFVLIQLAASYDTLRERVLGRADPYRISTQEALDAYLAERSISKIDDEHIVETSGLTPQQVAHHIMELLQGQNTNI